MITYKEYMADSTGLHHSFYLDVAQAARLSLSKDMEARVRASIDEHLNDIPLALWDALAHSHRFDLDYVLRARGAYYSLCSGVCAFKALARHLASGGAPVDNTIAGFIAEHGLRMKATRVASRSDGHEWVKGARHWRIDLHGPLGSLVTEYSQGSAHKEAPKLEDVLDCLRSDASDVGEGRAFESWASEYGYDTDSREAERTYFACLAIHNDLYRVLGAPAFKVLIENIERL